MEMKWKGRDSVVQFCICTYVFTAAFCLQFIKEYDDDDDTNRKISGSLKCTEKSFIR